MSVVCVMFNIVMVWVFNRTGQTLPMAMLFHVSINNFASVVWSSVFPSLHGDYIQHALLLGSSVAAGTLLVVTRGRLGHHPQRADRDVRHEPVPPRRP